jgi:hypothetical protein
MLFLLENDENSTETDAHVHFLNRIVVGHRKMDDSNLNKCSVKISFYLFFLQMFL